MPPDDAGQLETARALFDGGRLTQARQIAGLLKSELAKELDISAAAIGQFESGVAKPTTATLGRLAFALHVPPAFFAADRPRLTVPEDQVHFRSLRSTSNRERTKARAQVEILAQVVEALERRVRLPRVDLPAMPTDPSPEDAARLVREGWQLGAGPIKDLVGLLERRGVIISRLSAVTEAVDAFSCWIADRPYIVLAATKDAADRSRFDAAHELAHLLLHEDALPGDPEIERLAHRFAAELLTPAESIEPLLPPRVDWRHLAMLKLQWGVSMAMLLRRMRDLGVISDASFRRGMMDLGRRDWRKSEPVKLGRPEEPELLSRALALLERERNFGLDDLANDVALSPARLSELILALKVPSRADLSLA